MRGGPGWFIFIETLGILSFAINAMIVAKGKGLSALGVFVCAFATALGGGTLRDILLGPGAQPFFWVAFPFYLVAIFGVSLAYARTDVLRRAIGRRDRVIKETAEAIAAAETRDELVEVARTCIAISRAGTGDAEPRSADG